MKKIKIRIKQKDIVQIISGKEKNQIGLVNAVDRKTGYVTVSGLNRAIRNVKPRMKYASDGTRVKGERMEVSLPLNPSKVLLYCPDCKKGVRHFITPLETEKKLYDGSHKNMVVKKRHCSQCKVEIDHTNIDIHDLVKTSQSSTGVS